MKPRRRSHGFTLVELSLSISVVVVSLLGTTAAVFAATRLDATVQQTQESHRAAQSLIERVRATPFDQIAATWSGTGHDVALKGGNTTATLLVTPTTVASGTPVLEVRVRVADPGDASKTLISTTLYVSRDNAVAATTATAQ